MTAPRRAMFRSTLRRCAAALLLVTPIGEAVAWDGVETGKIVQIHLTEANNFGARIYLEGVTAMCGSGSADWAYMNSSYDNYQATLAVLTTAWAAGKSVRLYTNRSGITCEIGYVIGM